MTTAKSKRSSPSSTRKSFAPKSLESFTVRQVHRRDILAAEYNPRMSGREERERLKRSVRKHGLVEPLVWNEHTGNLVGGHQRLAVLDEMQGTLDYTLTVSVINVSPAEERRINVLLNNPSAQGRWDLESLDALLKDEGMRFAEFGFGEDDVAALFPDHDWYDAVEKAPDEAGKSEVEKIAALRQRRKDFKAQSVTQTDESEFFLVVVFRSREETEAFQSHCGLNPEVRYIAGESLATIVGLELHPTSSTRPVNP